MATYYWTGNGANPDWSFTGNWNSGNIPTFLDSAIFGVSGQGDCALSEPSSAYFLDFTGYTGTFNTSGNTFHANNGITFDTDNSTIINTNEFFRLYGGRITIIDNTGTEELSASFLLHNDVEIQTQGSFVTTPYVGTISASVSGQFDITFTAPTSAQGTHPNLYLYDEGGSNHRDTYINSGAYVSTWFPNLTENLDYWFGTGCIILSGGEVAYRSDNFDIHVQNHIITKQIGGYLYDGPCFDAERGHEFDGGIELHGPLYFGSTGGFGQSSSINSPIWLMPDASECRLIMFNRSFRQIALDGGVVDISGNTNPLILDRITSSRREFFFTTNSPNWSSGLIVTSDNLSNIGENQHSVVVFSDVPYIFGTGDVTFNGGNWRQSQPANVWGDLTFINTCGFWQFRTANTLNCMGTVHISGALDFEQDLDITELWTSSQDSRDLQFYYSNSLNDGSNENNDGTDNGTIESNGFGLLPFRDDSSFYFDGVDDWIGVPTSGPLGADSVDSRSVHFLFRTIDVTGNQMLYQEGDSDNGMNIRLDGDTLVAAVYDSSGSYYELTSQIEQYEIYQVLYRWQGDDGGDTQYVDLWVNNKEVGSLSEPTSSSGLIPDGWSTARTSGNAIGWVDGSTVVSSSNDLWIGNHFNGYLSHILVWNSAIDDGYHSDLRECYAFNMTNSVGISASEINMYDGSSIRFHGDHISTTLPCPVVLHGGEITLGNNISDFLTIEQLKVEDTTNITLGCKVMIYSDDDKPFIINNSGGKLSIEGNGNSTSLIFVAGNREKQIDFSDFVITEGSLEFSGSPIYSKQKTTSVLNITGQDDSLPSALVFRHCIEDLTINLEGTIRSGSFDGEILCNLDNTTTRTSRGFTPILNFNMKNASISCNNDIKFNFSTIQNTNYNFNLNMEDSSIVCGYQFDGNFISNENSIASLSMKNSKILCSAQGYGSYPDLFYTFDNCDYDDDSYWIVTDFSDDVDGDISEINMRSQNPLNNNGKEQGQINLMLGYRSKDKPYDPRPSFEDGSKTNPILVTAGYDSTHNLSTVYKYFQVEGKVGWMLESYDVNSPYDADTHFIIHEENFDWKNLIGRNEDSYNASNSQFCSQFIFPNNRTYYIRITDYNCFLNEDPSLLSNEDYGLRMVQVQNPKRKQIRFYTGFSPTQANGKFGRLIINDANIEVFNNSDDILTSTVEMTINDNGFFENDDSRVVNISAGSRLNIDNNYGPVSNPVNLNLYNNLNNTNAPHIDLKKITCINHKLNVVKANDKGNNTNINFRRPW